MKHTNIQPMEFTYDTDAVSKRQFEEHVKLYKGYVTKVNEITDDLKSNPDEKAANSAYSKYRGLKKGETYALDGVLYHELYFQNLCRTESMPCKEMNEMFNSCFGGYDCWLDDFKACAMATRGWCILCYEQRTGTFRNILSDLHDYGVVCMAYPIIVLDMYEHAYFLDYGINKDAYIDRFIKSIKWDVVDKRFRKVLTLREH